MISKEAAKKICEIPRENRTFEQTMELINATWPMAETIVELYKKLDAQALAAARVQRVGGNLLDENKELRRLLTNLVEGDEDECSFDHHGNCQTHYIENPCSVAAARALLGLS